MVDGEKAASRTNTIEHKGLHAPHIDHSPTKENMTLLILLPFLVCSSSCLLPSLVTWVKSAVCCSISTSSQRPCLASQCAEGGAGLKKVDRGLRTCAVWAFVWVRYDQSTRHYKHRTAYLVQNHQWKAGQVAVCAWWPPAAACHSHRHPPGPLRSCPAPHRDGPLQSQSNTVLHLKPCVNGLLVTVQHCNTVQNKCLDSPLWPQYNSVTVRLISKWSTLVTVYCVTPKTTFDFSHVRYYYCPVVVMTWLVL